MFAGAATAADAAAASDAGAKPSKAADDKGKPAEAELAPKPVVKPRRDRKVGPIRQTPLCCRKLLISSCPYKVHAELLVLVLGV